MPPSSASPTDGENLPILNHDANIVSRLDRIIKILTPSMLTWLTNLLAIIPLLTLTIRTEIVISTCRAIVRASESWPQGTKWIASVAKMVVCVNDMVKRESPDTTKATVKEQLDRIESLSKEVAGLRRKGRDDMSVIRDLRRANATKDATILALETDGRLKATRMQELDDAAFAQAKHDSELADAKADLGATSQKIKDLEEQLASANSAVGQLRAGESTSSKTIADLRTRLKGSEEEVQGLKERLSDSKEVIVALRRSVEDLATGSSKK